MTKLKWQTKFMEKYWFVAANGIIYRYYCYGAKIDKNVICFGNCFRTKREAIRARNAMKKVLKGLG